MRPKAFKKYNFELLPIFDDFSKYFFLFHFEINCNLNNLVLNIVGVLIKLKTEMFKTFGSIVNAYTSRPLAKRARLCRSCVSRPF